MQSEYTKCYRKNIINGDFFKVYIYSVFSCANQFISMIIMDYLIVYLIFGKVNPSIIRNRIDSVLERGSYNTDGLFLK